MLPTPTTRTRTSPMLPSPLASIAFRRIIACGRTAGNRPGGKRLPSEERGFTKARPASGSSGFQGVRVQATIDRLGSFGLQRLRVWTRSSGLGSFGLERARAWATFDRLGFVRVPGSVEFDFGSGSFGVPVGSGFVWP